MFNFHKLALQNAKPQNAKVLLFTIVSFIILFALTILTFMPLQPAIYKLMMSMAMQQSVVGPIIGIVLAILVPILVFLFVGYPLIAGTIYTIDKALNKDKVNFKDLFSVFAKGKYLKAIKLSLITVLLIIIALVLGELIAQLLQLGIVQLYQAIQGPLSKSDHALGYSLTFQIIAGTLTLFIKSFIYWLLAIIIINYTVAFIKEPKNGAWNSVKRGFKGIKNGQKTWFKFYIGLLLLNLIVIILASPVSQLISILTGGISQNIATILIYIVHIIVIIVRLAVYYTNTLAIIQYYNRNGEPTNHNKSKKDKKKNANITDNQDSKVNNSVTNTTEKAKANVDQKSDQLQDKTKDEAKNLKNNLNQSDK